MNIQSAYRHAGGSAVGALLVALFLGAPSAHSTNPAFQDFFFGVCGTASGTLADRCNQTPGGLGDLSSDSESSLNPSQTLATPAGAAASSRLRLAEASESENTFGTQIESGRYSLLLNLRHNNDELDRTVDIDPERGFEADAIALQLGVDYRASDTLVIGGWLHWEDSDLDFDPENPGENFAPTGNAGNVEQDAVGLSIFTGINLNDKTYLDFSLGYLRSDYSIERRALFQESTRQVATTAVVTDASTDGDEFWASIASGFSRNRGAWSYGPFVSLNYADIQVDGYREADLGGSGLAMTVSDTEIQRLRGIVGVRASAAISGNGFVFLPQLLVQYSHNLMDDASSSTINFQQDSAGQTFNFRGDGPDDGQFDISLGGAFQFRNGWNAFMEARTTLGYQDYNSYAVVAGLRVEL